ncbi:MAG: UvrD-helicase domain-containing protein [Erysipelotrichaceae bacterium]|nr:UvrD-helicase domain-containing protein [Erysipelotrichaceae bacterium]
MTDQEARKLIISDIASNLFVEAGAGSGKTTMLVERMVAMVEKGLPVEKICTITFTKAAAN